MKKAVLICATLLLTLDVKGLWAQSSVLQNTTVAAYISAVQSARSGSEAQALEKAFSSVKALRRELIEKQGSNGNILETLSQEDYEQLSNALPCVILNREETLYVLPNVNCFAQIAEASGSPVDKAFFSAHSATYPSGVWPVYIEQQTDYSGCTRFGEMVLVNTYKIWDDFLKQHPGRYTMYVKDQISEVERNLSYSTCACGDLNSVRSELEAFSKRYPNSNAKSDIAQRLNELGAGKTEIRANCISG